MRSIVLPLAAGAAVSCAIAGAARPSAMMSAAASAKGSGLLLPSSRAICMVSLLIGSARTSRGACRRGGTRDEARREEAVDDERQRHHDRAAQHRVLAR